MKCNIKPLKDPEVFPNSDQNDSFISMFSLTFHVKKEQKESFIEELVNRRLRYF